MRSDTRGNQRKTSRRSKPLAGRNLRPWIEILILAGIIWLVHFQLFHSLGLYEDDYAFIGKQLEWKPADLLDYMKVVATWPQGRPIQFLLPRALTVLAGYLDGIRTLYVLAFLLQAANGILFLLLLRRLGLGASSLPGALIFSLYPADTTHTFLMHALGAHPALTFLLVAAHLYLSGHKWLAHLLSAGALLTYESAYMPFLAVPLLQPEWGGRLRKELARHALTWLAILAVAVAVRVVLGEARIEALAAGTNFSQLLGHIGLGLVMGPAVSVGLLGIGPAWVIANWQASLGLLFVAVLTAMVWLLGRTGEKRRPSNQKEAAGAQAAILSPRRCMQLAVAGLAMLSLAYALSFTHFPPTVQYGRATSVHLASAVGGALLVACLLALALPRIRTPDGRAAAALLLAFYLATLAAYRYAIQIDFRQAWSNQRSFWGQVTRLVPDVSDGTMVFVLNHDLPRTRFIYTNSWADPIVLEQLYDFPDEWELPPRVFVVPANWTDAMLADGGGLRWQVPAATWRPHWETLPDGNVIVLEMEAGRLVRRSGELSAHGRSVTLKQLAAESLPAEPPVQYPAGPLYPCMLGVQ